VRRKNPLDRLRFVFITAVAIAAAAGAHADTGDPAPGDAAGAAGELQEIVVTSQKRREDIKDIPISVSAISGTALAEHHIADYDDITRTVPGISFQAGAGPGLDNIQIRGVSSTSGSATVGIYIDEVSVTTPNFFDGAVQPKLFDLDRIEVLRGPQGTLYGASSMGGTVRFITKQPDLTRFSASVSTDLSDTHHGGFNNDEFAVLNVPVVDGVFALRFGVDLSTQSGYIDHYVPTPTGAGPDGSVLTLATNDSTGDLGKADVNAINTQVFRLSGKYAGPDDLTIVPAWFWQRTNAEDSSIFYPAIGLYDQDKRVAEPGVDVVSVPSVTLVKNFGWAELTSVTSYFSRDFKRITDGTYYNSNIFANFSVLGSVPSTPAQTYAVETLLGFLASPVYYDTKTEQFSQELRLASQSTSVAGVSVGWTVGLYFAKQFQAHTDDEFIPGLQATFQQIYGYNINDSAVGGQGPNGLAGVSYADDLIYQGHEHVTEKQIAPFGEIGVEITPQLKGAVGLRYVSAKSTYDFNSAGYYAYGLPNFASATPYESSQTFSSTTPKVSLEYAVSDASNLYATVAKGFRLGGPTGPVPADEPGGSCDPDYEHLGLTSAPTQFQSDSLWSYELGSKGRYFNNRLSINADVYAIHWSNIQQTINLPTCGFGFTTNVGDAKSFGSEFELQALVTPSLTLGLNAGTTHAYITSVAALATDIVYHGESVLNVPKFTLTPSADYDVSVAESTQAFVRVDYPYTGRSRAYFDSSDLANLFSPGYGIVNLNLGVKRGALTVGLYAKNLLNWKNVIQYPSVNTVQEGYTVRPLTIGINALLQL
jgi:outer membrane receptor protein involved in Fe transport